MALRINRSIEIGESTGSHPWLSAAQARQKMLEVDLRLAETPHPSAEEMQRRQPKLDEGLAALPDEKQMILAGIAEALRNQQN